MRHQAAAHMPQPDAQSIVVELPWRTLFKVLAAAALVWVWLRTSQLFLLLTLAVLIAVALDPVVRRVERRGLPRWGAATLVAFSLLASVTLFLFFAAESLPSQGRLVATRMVAAEQGLAQHVPAFVRDAVGAEDPETWRSPISDH